MPASRSYDRAPADLRPVTIEPGFVRTADGSALISQGETRVICTASVTDSVPRWMEGKGRGWVTAEYSMLPASTGERKAREISRGKQDGRGVEIQRLIGRSLRGVVDFAALGERSVYVDCDVLQADGGTRCAAITGGFVALQLALAKLVEAEAIERIPLDQSVAALSVGMVDGRAMCDLDYAEDSAAEVDANVVMTGDGGLVEVQATAERMPLSRASLDRAALPGGSRDRPAQASTGIGSGHPRRLRSWADDVGADPGHPQRAQAARAARGAPGRRDRTAAGGDRAPPEVGETFAENALHKARAARAATGRAAIADDSGIEAYGLGGRPGVRSARYAGEGASDEENLSKLLDEVARADDRRVAYVCAIALVAEDGEESLFEGRCEGTLATEPRGSGGFGYDPAFIPEDTGPEDARTMAELAPAEKHAISHRGRAARALAEHLGVEVSG